MATAEIDSGICGFKTTVHAEAVSMREVRLTCESTCPHVAEMAQELTQVDPFTEISFRGEGPLTLRLAAQHLAHPACPVPVGILKAIEVTASLALPKDAVISPRKD